MKFAPLAALLALGSWQLPSQSLSAPARKADVIVYGGTSAAVTAAVQVRRMGKSVIVVSPDRHLGGLSSGGLGFTDTGNKAVIANRDKRLVVTDKLRAQGHHVKRQRRFPRARGAEDQKPTALYGHTTGMQANSGLV